MQYMKRLIKWTIWLLLTPVLLLVAATALLYVPPVQRWAVEKAASMLKQQTGMDIQMKSVRIAFPLDINLQGLNVRKDSVQLATLEHCTIDLDLSRIWQLKGNVDGIVLKQGTIDTRDLIDDVMVKAVIGQLSLQTRGIDMNQHTADIGWLRLKESMVDISLADTAQTDTTTSTPLPWRISLHKGDILKTQLKLSLPGDTTRLDMGLNAFRLQGGKADLEAGIYSVGHASMDADSLHYDITTADSATWGMDLNHLALDGIRMCVRDACYRMQDGALDVKCLIRGLREKSGFSMQRLTATVQMDTARLRVDDLLMKTPYSAVTGLANLHFDALKKGKDQRMDLHIQALIGREDIGYLTGSMLPEGTLETLPEKPVQLQMHANGNVDTLRIERCELKIPHALEARVVGCMQHLYDTKMSSGKLESDICTHNLLFVEKMIGVKGLRLPSMHLSARLEKRQDQYQADALLQRGKGRLHLLSTLHAARMEYKARMDVINMNVHDFLPHDSIYRLDAHATLQGRGTDMLDKATELKAQLTVEGLQFRNHNLDDMALKATLKNGKGVLDLHSNNSLLKAHSCMEADLSHRQGVADFSLNLNHIDLYALHLSKDTLSASMVMRVDGSTDFKDRHKVDGHIQAMEMVTKDSIYHPLDLSLSVLLHPDSVFAKATAGDLRLMVRSPEGYKTILKKADATRREAIRQKEQFYINQDTLRSMLPRVECHIYSGKNNPVQNMIRHATGFTYNELLLDLDANPDTGVQGEGHLHSIHTGALGIDTVWWQMTQDTAGINLRGKVRNNARNKTVVFESNWFANITPTGVETGLEYLDAQRRKGIDAGMKIDITEEGIRMMMTPLNPIIAYRRFTLNPDNFVELTRDGRLEALVDLLADDGTGIKLYSIPNEEAKQDLSLNINHLNLGELSMVMPYMPSIQGLLQGDIHYVQADSSFTLSTDMQVKGMQYEHNPLGDVGLNMVYFPNQDGTHYIDGIVSHNGNEVMLLSGQYMMHEEGDSIEATAELIRMPMRTANAFIPDNLARLDGYADGTLQIGGKADNPLLEGFLATDSLHIISDPYNVNLRVADDTIHITHSIVNLDRIDAYAISRNPMVMDGTVNLQDWSDIRLDLALAATGYQLINAPKTRTAQAYGKVYVDVNANMKGSLDNLKMRGRLSVLGNTDVTYVLKDSPINAEDQLDGLVEFVDFTDTLGVETHTKEQAQKIDMVFVVNIEQAAQIHCLLSEDGKDYVNLEGGGELTFTYSNHSDMQLFGRYTILGGDMNYSIMELVSKHFNLISGSYVEFQGDILNPKLKISANERVKSTVTEGNVPRSVAFDVGIRLSQTLRNMGLEFTLDAPEDMSVQNELAAMSTEQKGRVAVTMLATGLFLTDNYKSSGVSSTNALYNYLQSQVGAIAGKALNTIDLKFGIENTTDQTGASQTDYNFSFAKRFWGNRLRVIVGGKVSSGENAVNNGQTIIDNVSLEYRLDNTATRYIKLYYDKNYESLLEGELTEMGAGAVFRRKSTKLGDLFIFRKKKK